MSANLTWLNGDLYRDTNLEIAQNLVLAMQEPKTSMARWKIISTWKLDGNIENSFTPGYCTYGAAIISPEFFPYIDEKTQQRTWWGNAVNRCENAQATWYKVWMTPLQWSLIVYGNGDRFSNFGHVGKVMHYNKTLKKIIVRDMARAWRFVMTDRWDDSDNVNIKCFIYNWKSEIWITDDQQASSWINNNWTVVNNGNTTGSNTSEITNNVSNDNTTTTTKTGVISNNNTHASSNNTNSNIVISIPAKIVDVWKISNASSTTENQKTNVVNVPVVNNLVVETQIWSTGNINLNFDNWSDWVKHFVSQWDVSAQLYSPSNIKIWDELILKFTIKNKDSNEWYNGLLNKSLNIITSNDKLATNYSTIQLVNNGEIIVIIKAIQSGQSSIIINMWWERVSKISLNID